jgi:tellurite resistance protein TerC
MSELQFAQLRHLEEGLMTALEPFFLAEFLGTATWLWLVFISIVIGLLVFDLGVLHREHREIGIRESSLARFHR